MIPSTEPKRHWYRDFVTEKRRFTWGRFSHWEEGGPLNAWYAVFRTRGGGYVLVPEYLLEKETKAALPDKAWGNFKKHAVEAESVADFLQRYYKPARLAGHEAGLLASYQRDFDDEGFCFISCHDSVTGEYVAYFKWPLMKGDHHG
jgi:hypothetical protein